MDEMHKESKVECKKNLKKKAFSTFPDQYHNIPDIKNIASYTTNPLKRQNKKISLHAPQ